MPGQRRYIRVEGDVAIIPLTQGYEAVIDAADVPLVDGRNWSAAVQRNARGQVRTVYAFHKAKSACTMLHRAIIGAPDGAFVDHINGNGLDNRRSNLRLADKVQNGANSGIRVNNTSGFKGVNRHGDLWRAKINVLGKTHHLGLFPTAEQAAAAYAAASLKFHGDFARSA
jgi:hypothetical protein